MRLIITIVFAALACWFAMGPQTAAVPLPERPELAPEVLAGQPLRATRAEPAELSIGGQMLKCNACHELFESKRTTQDRLAQHTEIELQHGMNNRCLNCHDHGNRERLVLNDGTLVGLDEAPILCAQCHGPTWRDWQRGIHGRTSGYWDTTRGPAEKLGCTQCHNPHSPAFPGIAPAPGPWTLRMGDPPEHGGQTKQNSPLRRWSAVLDQVHEKEDPSDG
ncbi:MAG: hypothetical protein ACI9EF_003074 [Pseudohongiellaceae bacterium]|jgi:hypothetical protein